MRLPGPTLITRNPGRRENGEGSGGAEHTPIVESHQTLEAGAGSSRADRSPGRLCVRTARSGPGPLRWPGVVAPGLEVRTPPPLASWHTRAHSCPSIAGRCCRSEHDARSRQDVPGLRERDTTPVRYGSQETGEERPLQALREQAFVLGELGPGRGQGWYGLRGE